MTPRLTREWTPRVGVAAELAVLRELTSPAYELATVSAEDLGTVADLVERYNDSNIGRTERLWSCWPAATAPTGS